MGNQRIARVSNLAMDVSALVCFSYVGPLFILMAWVGKGCSSPDD